MKIVYYTDNDGVRCAYVDFYYPFPEQKVIGDVIDRVRKVLETQTERDMR